MAERIIMPKQGLQMAEGTIIEWIVSEGGDVVEGEPLFTMETDKLSITIDASVSGTMLKIVRGEGETVPITETIAVVGEPGEDISALLGGEMQSATAEGFQLIQAQSRSDIPAAYARSQDSRVFITPRARMRAEELQLDYSNLIGTAPDGTIIERDILQVQASEPRATPLARKTAELEGVPLTEIAGTGARGKILREDVLNASKPESAVVSAAPKGARKILPLRGMRKVIAERMKQSLNVNAQASHCISVRMDKARALRESLGKTVGYNDLIAYATARALRDFPQMNAELTDEGIWQKEFVNLGIAVALDDGLIVPVIRGADKLTLTALSEQIKAKAKKARDGQLLPEEYTDGTFTVSNLGMIGLEEFGAIINPPEAGILAVGQIADTPVAVDGRVEIHPVMKLTLSYDHRVIDGAPAAHFLVRIREYLENPYKLL